MRQFGGEVGERWRCGRCFIVMMDVCMAGGAGGWLGCCVGGLGVWMAGWVGRLVSGSMCSVSSGPMHRLYGGVVWSSSAVIE